jgi:hypothetical protein
LWLAVRQEKLSSIPFIQALNRVYSIKKEALFEGASKGELSTFLNRPVGSQPEDPEE